MGVRTAARPLIARALWPVLRPARGAIERGRDGRRLRPGITAIVVARDEDYTVRFALRSLLGFADQIICVDNGSQDRTLHEMEAFRDEHGDEAAVDVVSMPGALVGELWDAGLERTRHQWFSPWDADMVAKASILDFRTRVLADGRPRTIRMPTTNLGSDLRHIGRLGAVSYPNEPKLFRFGRAIRYREYGRYYAVRLPLHYIEAVAPDQYFTHLMNVKSDDNLIHRFHYWTWRETVNREGDALDPELRSLDGFKQHRNEELFGTNDPRSLKWRYQRQLSYHQAPYDPEVYGAYPEVLQEELTRPQRFEVTYRNGLPWNRIDREDEEMRGYEPTEEDLAWDAEAFLARFLSGDDLRQLGIEPSVTVS